MRTIDPASLIHESWLAILHVHLGRVFAPGFASGWIIFQAAACTQSLPFQFGFGVYRNLGVDRLFQVGIEPFFELGPGLSLRTDSLMSQLDSSVA